MLKFLRLYDSTTFPDQSWSAPLGQPLQVHADAERPASTTAIARQLCKLCILWIERPCEVLCSERAMHVRHSNRLCSSAHAHLLSEHPGNLAPVTCSVASSGLLTSGPAWHLKLWGRLVKAGEDRERSILYVCALIIVFSTLVACLRHLSYTACCQSSRTQHLLLSCT